MCASYESQAAWNSLASPPSAVTPPLFKKESNWEDDAPASPTVK